jgi:hypothetical protein
VADAKRNGASSGESSGDNEKPRHPKARKTSFKPGHEHRWPKGKSGNPEGRRLRRPFVEAAVAFYGEKPERAFELVERLHRAVAGKPRKKGERALQPVEVQAFRELARKADLEHLRDDGSENRQVLEGITLEFATDRPPERAKIKLSESTPKTTNIEIEWSDGAPPPIVNGNNESIEP